MPKNYPAKNVDHFDEEKPCTPHLSTTIAQRLEQSLRNTIDPFDALEEIDVTVEKTLHVLSGFLKKYPHRHQQIFNEVCNFFNNLFSSCHLRNFYNSAPNIKLSTYNETGLSDQLVNNVYVRSSDEKLFLNETMKGASCHYWSIFMKNVFDRLQEIGMPIESYIYMFNEKTSRHSGVILKYKSAEGEDQNFIVDVGGINKSYKKLILPLDQKQNFFAPQIRSGLMDLVERKNDKDACFYFDTKEEFIEQIGKKKSLAISLEFHSPLAGEHAEFISIKITSGTLHLSKGGLEWDLKYDQEAFLEAVDSYNKNPTLEKGDPLLSALFNAIAFPNNEVKAIWGKYFDLLEEKIDPERLAFVAGYKSKVK